MNCLNNFGGNLVTIFLVL